MPKKSPLTITLIVIATLLLTGLFIIFWFSRTYTIDLPKSFDDVPETTTTEPSLIPEVEPTAEVPQNTSIDDNYYALLQDKFDDVMLIREHYQYTYDLLVKNFSQYVNPDGSVNYAIIDTSLVEVILGEAAPRFAAIQELVEASEIAAPESSVYTNAFNLHRQAIVSYARATSLLGLSIQGANPEYVAKSWTEGVNANRLYAELSTELNKLKPLHKEPIEIKQ